VRCETRSSARGPGGIPPPISLPITLKNNRCILAKCVVSQDRMDAPRGDEAGWRERARCARPEAKSCSAHTNNPVRYCGRGYLYIVVLQDLKRSGSSASYMCELASTLGKSRRMDAPEPRRRVGALRQDAEGRRPNPVARPPPGGRSNKASLYNKSYSVERRRGGLEGARRCARPEAKSCSAPVIPALHSSRTLGRHHEPH